MNEKLGAGGHGKNGESVERRGAKLMFITSDDKDRLAARNENDNIMQHLSSRTSRNTCIIIHVVVCTDKGDAIVT